MINLTTCSLSALNLTSIKYPDDIHCRYHHFAGSVLRQVEHLCLILSHLQREACLCDLDPKHRRYSIRTIHRASCFAVSSVSAVEQILAMVGSWRLHTFLNAASCDRTTQLADRFCAGHTGYGNDSFFAYEDAGEMEVGVSVRTWRLVSNCVYLISFFG